MGTLRDKRILVTGCCGTVGIELERYFSVKPAFESLYRDMAADYPGVVSEQVDRAYHSANETLLTKGELRRFLYDNELLEGEEKAVFHPDKRFWG